MGLLDKALGSAITHEEREARDKVPTEADIGSLIPGRGIYLGVLNLAGRFSSQDFHVFAAPEDLTLPSGGKILMSYDEAVRIMAEHKNWHGHAGGHFQDDRELYKALGEGRGIGDWFIPPRLLLDGNNQDENKLRKNNMFDLRNVGAFNGTFTTDRTPSGLTSWYMSSTQDLRNSGYVMGVTFADGRSTSVAKNRFDLSCRPCRVERVVAAPTPSPAS